MIGAGLCGWITSEFDNYEIDASIRNKLFKRSSAIIVEKTKVV